MSQTVNHRERFFWSITIVETAKANGVNVYHYLTYLLKKCPSSTMTDEELEQLAPWNENVKSELEQMFRDDPKDA